MAVCGEAVAEDDVLGVLALDEHVGAADGPGLGVELLAVDLQMGLGVELGKVVLGGRQHAAGAAGGVVHGPYGGLTGECLLVLGEEDVDHEADDLARGEVLTRGLVLHLREPTEQLLKDVAHRVVGHLGRVQVDVGELGDDLVEQPGLVEGFDLLSKPVLLQDRGGVAGEPCDVGKQVALDVLVVVQQTGERQWAGVVERRAGDPLQDRVDIPDLPFERSGTVDDLLLGGLQDTVEAAKDDEGQDELPELVLADVAAQQVSDRPDERDLVVEAFDATHGVDALASSGLSITGGQHPAPPPDVCIGRCSGL